MAQSLKRILIVSYYFGPQNAIGAVRPTKLAKYLVRMGHEVTVICGIGMTSLKDPTLERDMRELKDVHVVREWNPLRAWKARKREQAVLSGASKSAAAPKEEAPKTPPLLHRAADAAYLYLWWLADRSFAHRAVRELRRLKGPYDAVFSSYAPFSVHEIAREAKRQGIARKWIADFRDEVNLSFGWQAGRKARYMRMLRREADVLTAVSQGFLEMMDFQDVGRVLSNGYDREDLPAAGAPMKHDRLRVVYCGLLSMARKNVPDRDLTPMFRALRALAGEGALPLERLTLVYAGSEGALFRSQAASCGLEGCVEDHGLVRRDESIRLQQSADILLMASWHTQAQRGILTGKLFEYMMMDKPIVCCMGGDAPGSGVKRVLQETGMGVCCEAACAQADEAALKRYLAQAAERWKNGAPLLAAKRQAEVDGYAYPELARTLAEWMDEA